MTIPESRQMPRLDEETERVISKVFESQASHARVLIGEPTTCYECIKALTALRFRIRELVEEARKEGASPTPISDRLNSIIRKTLGEPPGPPDPDLPPRPKQVA